MAIGVFRTLAAIVLAWYVFRYLNKWAARKDQQRDGVDGQGDFGGGRGPASSSSSKGRKPSDTDLGEYVDYEEFDED
jgi:hypothetical protein